MLEPTQVGDWKKICDLGQGAFGMVSLWRNETTSECIAIKKCKLLSSSLSTKQKERWHSEVEFMKSIDHPNIISYKAVVPILEDYLNQFNPSALPLLPMEYCKKGNLQRYLISEPIKLCGLPEHDIRYILEDVSGGLEYLHMRGITHRDIKPDNIVLQHCSGRRGETLYKIIDLGYAKELQDKTLSFVGTFHYLAPEIFYNRPYGPPVDYWSLGIMIFQVICGTLPFLPQLAPFEKFEKIKNKAEDDICIYTSYCGSITTSKEIKLENFVSSCFKEYIEKFLKKTLQMDAAKRIFPNNLSLFQYVKFILDIKIIRVFSVYKQEFYSYEIKSSMLFATLKEWISRDIKVPSKDLLFILRKNGENNGKIWYSFDDNVLLKDFVPDGDCMLYVYKKDSLFTYIEPKLPYMIRELFKSSSLQGQYLQLYRKALFLIYSNLQVVNEFKTAINSLSQYLEEMTDRLKSKAHLAGSELGKVILKVGEFCKKAEYNGNISSEEREALKDCLKHIKRLISSVERRNESLREFGKQRKLFGKAMESLGVAQQKINDLFKKCDIQSRFDNINNRVFLEKPKNPEIARNNLNNIKKLISDAIKFLLKLLKEEQPLQCFSNDLSALLKWSEQLNGWIDDFNVNIKQLFQDLVASQIQYCKLLKAVNYVKNTAVLSVDIERTKALIKENELVMCQLRKFYFKTQCYGDMELEETEANVG